MPDNISDGAEESCVAHAELGAGSGEARADSGGWWHLETAAQVSYYPPWPAGWWPNCGHPPPPPASPLIRCFHLETNSRENTAAWMPAADLVANPRNVEFLCSLSSFRASSSSDRSLTFLANFDDSDKARTTTYIPIPNTKRNIKCSRLMLRQCESAWSPVSVVQTFPLPSPQSRYYWLTLSAVTLWAGGELGQYRLHATITTILCL